ncbi:MAG TPA: asparagine synthase (glutamine-hydrolyzing) [Steroidobacteraceae bacterium]|nr:asparagine synthase (glutamine-hydrolyzing) [Steroidobacteraceae bacterium]
MCGILGYAMRSTGVEPMSLERFRNALMTLRHRGPDGSGIFQDRNVWLGHSRLSILDLSDAGAQPMRTADDRFVITYNGETYNFREIAAEGRLGDLVSRSDTEVIVRSFAARGVSVLPSLNGMFAFAIYDKVDRKILLARDRAGIKPLYYRIDSRGLAFASEMKGIAALSDEDPTCNLAALHEWLYYGNALGGRTLHAGIHQLLPGHYLQFDVDTFDHRIEPYHGFRGSSAGVVRGAGGVEEAASRVRELLEAAVRRQLVSDVPVGIFLSGGVDSSAITAFASRHYRGRLATFSAGFDFAGDVSELPGAKRVAGLFGTDHHEVRIAGADVGAIVEKMVYHHDAPFADAANIPLYLMAESIRSDIKVVLQGDGGDEVFGGYRRYATLRYYRFLRNAARALRWPCRFGPRFAPWYRFRRYLDALSARDLATTMALLLTQESPAFRPQEVFSEEIIDSLVMVDPFARFREVQPRFAIEDICNQMSLTDMCIEMPDLFLEKVDRSTMAAGLEVRVPFLDNDLLDYTTGLTGDCKMPGGRKKWLLKKALGGVVPDDVLRGRKRGLTVPYGFWLQTALKPMFFDHLSTFMRVHPRVLNRATIERMFARTRDGRQNHSFMLWKVLNFMVWTNTCKIRFPSKVMY